MPPADTWVAIAPATDIPAGHAARIEVDGVPIAIFNVNGEFHCLDDTCSHAEASLSDGDLDTTRCLIECPLHGSAFDLRTGAALTLPAFEPVRVHPCRVTEGILEIEVAT